MFKRELEEKWRKIDELKDKEGELREKIGAGKVELQNVSEPNGVKFLLSPFS